MDWILHHLQLIIAIAGAAAWWLNQRRQAQTGGEEPRKEVTFDDPELAERTRRIREEIQRKIEERARSYTHPAPLEEKSAGSAGLPPVVHEMTLRPPEPPALSRAAVAQQEDRRTAEILAQQAALAEKLRLAGELKARGMVRAQSEIRISSGGEATTVARSALVDDLRDADALRRAFILREILGPPVALR